MTQWITIAKIGGMAGDLVAERLREWSAARHTANPNLWSPDQWPIAVRKQADEFADRLLANCHAPPVVYMVRWVDMWLGGYAFPKWLTPPDGRGPNIVYTDRYEIFGYTLPDAGALKRHLASAGPQQFTESDWLVRRLYEAVTAWEKLVDRSVLVVVRRAIGGSVSDEELVASLSGIPAWLR